MSATQKIKRTSITDIRARKGGTPVVCLTAYTTPMARLMDEHVDLMLVGDSLGMVLYGMDSTLGVTVDMMINHGKAVMRGAGKACVVVDMPFGSYQESPSQAFHNAARIMAETGCSAVKLEGGAEMAETIAFLTQRGVPVMAHVGLQPQSVNTHGGYNARGRSKAEQQKILDDALAVAQAGAFSCVVEGTIEPLARRITEAIDIPTIGIGGSPVCDGQILVTEDMLGLFGEFTPKFVKRFANLGEQVDEAVARYAEEVRLRQFPGDAHIFKEKKPAKIVKSA